MWREQTWKLSLGDMCSLGWDGWMEKCTYGNGMVLAALGGSLPFDLHLWLDT